MVLKNLLPPTKQRSNQAISFNWCGYLTQEDRKSQRKVFKDADDMVHVAKSEGRNKVMFNPIVKL